MIQKIIFPFVLVLAIATFVGCGGGVQLTGTVTFEDGTPLEFGTVCFRAGGLESRGDVGSGGVYRVSTNRPGDGIPPGTYAVFLINTERGEMVPIPGSDGDFRDITVQTVAPKYLSPETSGLTVTIDRSTRTFDFQVERFQGQ